MQVKLHGLVAAGQASACDDAQVRDAHLNWKRRTRKESGDGVNAFVGRSLTRVAVVADGSTEDLLVVVKLERSQAFVFHRLSSHNIDGRLVLAPTVAIGVGPLVWHWQKDGRFKGFVAFEALVSVDISGGLSSLQDSE